MQTSDAHRFGTSSTFSIGIEEELLLVDDGLRLTPASAAVLEAVDERVRERVTTEIFATQIELKTGVCRTASEAQVELSGLRRAVRETGVELMGCGLHPDDDGEPVLVDKPRYEVVHKDLASLLDTPPCGLHVHVGMPDPETAVRVANALRHHLPVLQAITANSPFREGADSGLASARAAVVSSFPRFEMPRSFESYEEFCRVADQLIAAAGVDDYTYLWWDVRPHPRLGTVEVRGMDVQTEVEANAAVAALVQALAAQEIDRPQPHALCREALEESYFQASRHGLEARLLTDDETSAPAREVAEQALREARPYAQALGNDGALERLERIVKDGNGADDQRRKHRELGLEGLLADLVARTRGQAAAAQQAC